ncbi:hypothetical protein CC85DRAFT_287656 [Cutaneotrichosporon oleaginosum]|uniref:Uncharacterized protein n=1 Tax=Cutaneotrichosporon oleaginosum TaxID=879819 RepID=A0A0J0XGM8_9TREE|nr:uncharacterized protein CC85DRAFT_287656 [Cutaneotrichosporon oleaginosum]KLT40245.1 hypothetical protein CC85DRAFT_287656 [Cutaneotrichosporon oleaginosum]TXT11305.1 hypothetical protein COLE_01715 [Cutaneotrichosporon oleaginosum]
MPPDLDCWIEEDQRRNAHDVLEQDQFNAAISMWLTSWLACCQQMLAIARGCCRLYGRPYRPYQETRRPHCIWLSAMGHTILADKLTKLTSGQHDPAHAAHQFSSPAIHQLFTRARSLDLLTSCPISSISSIVHRRIIVSRADYTPRRNSCRTSRS